MHYHPRSHCSHRQANRALMHKHVEQQQQLTALTNQMAASTKTLFGNPASTSASLLVPPTMHQPPPGSSHLPPQYSQTQTDQPSKRDAPAPSNVATSAFPALRVPSISPVSLISSRSISPASLISSVGHFQIAATDRTAIPPRNSILPASPRFDMNSPLPFNKAAQFPS